MKTKSRYCGMKVLEIDIETAPNLVYTWGLFRQNIAINQIVDPGYILSFAAKWQHKPGVMYYDVQTQGEVAMIGALWHLLDEADAIVHYNGKTFDIKHIQREFLLHDYLPTSPFKQIDLLSVVRKQFRFASNKMAFVADQLGLGKKKHTGGMELWINCMNHDSVAWKKMRAYNIRDVRILGGMYKVLQPWIIGHPNRALWLDNPEKPTCPNCGHAPIHSRGTEKTKTMIYMRYHCPKCGTWARARRRKHSAAPGVVK